MISSRSVVRSLLVPTFPWVAAGLILAGCGNGVATSPQGAVEESPTPSQAGEASGLPTPPGPGSPEVRDISDVRLPLDNGDGGPPAPVRTYEDYDVDQREPVDTISVFYGYTGPLYSQLMWDRGMTVLEPTVGIDDTATWGADLLVRNDSLETVGAISVEVRLIGGDGQVVGTADATSPVLEARPGEPVPVSITSDVDQSLVSDVKWTTSAKAAPSQTERHLKSQFAPTAYPYGDREPIKTDLYDETGQSPPYPFLQGIAVYPTSNAITVSSMANVLAWMNEKGQVLEVAAAQPSMRNGAGFLVTVDNPAEAKGLETAYRLWWGVGYTQ